MPKFLAIILLWLGTALNVYAEIPKAGVTVSSMDLAQWPARYVIGLSVPSDHHAYLDSGEKNSYIPVNFDPDASLVAAGLSISHLTKPAGIYDDQVKATVLRGTGEFQLWLAPGNNFSPVQQSPNIPLKVEYQLCNDLTNTCFRPQTAQIELKIPVIDAASSEAASSTSLLDRLEFKFKHNKDNSLLIFGLMLIAGVLSTATPCVYPILPITSVYMLHRAKGSFIKQRQHALFYWLGIVGTYTVLGLAAGMTGGAFSSFMQSAWVNLAFALFFSLFALGLLGYFNLSFMEHETQVLEQRTAKFDGLFGTWLMGTVAGLVISPCVGPLVFALLLQIADDIADKAAALAAAQQSIGWFDRFAVASHGGLMMAGFGVGVGLPFFVVSIIDFKKLPKSGVWMNRVKTGFGVVILYFAYSYLSKGMGALGGGSATTLMFALGLMTIWIAVVHGNIFTGLSMEAQPSQKAHRYLFVMIFIIGVWLVIASLGKIPVIASAQAMQINNKVELPKNANCTSSLPAKEEVAGVIWHRSFVAAQKLAQQTNKPIFVDFYADWCANCVAFKGLTESDPDLNRVLREKTIAVKLIDGEPEFEVFRNDPNHRQLKIGLPYMAILAPDGATIWSTTNYEATSQIIAVLNGFRS